MNIQHYLSNIMANKDAVEGIAFKENLPKASELCTYSIGKKEITYRCVYVCKLKGKKYSVRFERINWI